MGLSCTTRVAKASYMILAFYPPCRTSDLLVSCLPCFRRPFQALVNSLLRADPSDRPTTKELLQHPYVRRSLQSLMGVPVPGGSVNLNPLDASTAIKRLGAGGAAARASGERRSTTLQQGQAAVAAQAPVRPGSGSRVGAVRGSVAKEAEEPRLGAEHSAGSGSSRLKRGSKSRKSASAATSSSEAVPGAAGAGAAAHVSGAGQRRRPVSSSSVGISGSKASKAGAAGEQGARPRSFSASTASAIVGAGGSGDAAARPSSATRKAAAVSTSAASAAGNTQQQEPEAKVPKVTARRQQQQQGAQQAQAKASAAAAGGSVQMVRQGKVSMP